MADGTPDDGEPHIVDLSSSALSILLTEDALRYSIHFNLYKNGQIVFHLKYLRLRGGLIFNDSVDGLWRSERFLRCEHPMSGGINVTLALVNGTPQIAVPGSPPFDLGDRFDISGKLTARVPQAIRISSQAGTPPVQAAPPVQMRTIEEAGMALGIDAVITSAEAFFVEGWIDDRRSALKGVSIHDEATGQREYLPAYRVRRPDVETHLQASRPHEFGFWTVHRAGAALVENNALSLVFSDGTGVPLQTNGTRRLGQSEFFEFLLSNFGKRNVIGNPTARSIIDLSAGLGAFFANAYKRIRATRSILSNELFGSARKPTTSLVCVLYGIPDFLYLLVSQFARFGLPSDLEFIFVNNSPEIEEVLIRDAEIASYVFNAVIRVVTLNQNSGFSHANNIGVSVAQGQSIAIINPDVFPRCASSVSHLMSLATMGSRTDVRGGKLYYADGSVMHEGMYFTKDIKLSALSKASLWTVEHYRKGFADTTVPEVRSVPAITGALMVIDRGVFMRMGGFDEEIIFGHYEDADLCLRIKDAGGRVLIDPSLAFWHYEGLGSIKRPEHIGSNLYNRWYFSQRWGRELEWRDNE